MFVNAIKGYKDRTTISNDTSLSNKVHKSRTTKLGLNVYAKFGGCYILEDLRFVVNIFFSAMSEYPTAKLTISKM